VPATLPEAIFHVEGDIAVPTELARGPWSPNAQHGGAPSALLAGLLDRVDAGPPAFTVRLTVDLMRPVPLAPLRMVTRVVRPGKKVQIVDASLYDGDVEVARATALRLRALDDELDVHWQVPEVAVLPPPSGSSAFPRMETGQVGYWNAVEMSPIVGQLFVPGPAAVWFRLRVPVVAGEEPSPLQRVAAVADFGNGVGSGIDRTRLTFINADVNITLHRLPVGEWVALDGVMFAETSGIGVAETVLHDERGRIGRGVQTVILEELVDGRAEL
jgi:Acyl-CoA thioesterase C-terminal domain/Acyl-CoA thioesterase N-terminal domain